MTSEQLIRLLPGFAHFLPFRPDTKKSKPLTTTSDNARSETLNSQFPCGTNACGLGRGIYQSEQIDTLPFLSSIPCPIGRLATAKAHWIRVDMNRSCHNGSQTPLVSTHRRNQVKTEPGSMIANSKQPDLGFSEKKKDNRVNCFTD